MCGAGACGVAQSILQTLVIPTRTCATYININNANNNNYYSSNIAYNFMLGAPERRTSHKRLFSISQDVNTCILLVNPSQYYKSTVNLG